MIINQTITMTSGLDYNTENTAIKKAKGGFCGNLAGDYMMEAAPNYYHKFNCIADK